MRSKNRRRQGPRRTARPAGSGSTPGGAADECSRRAPPSRRCTGRRRRCRRSSPGSRSCRVVLGGHRRCRGSTAWRPARRGTRRQARARGTSRRRRSPDVVDASESVDPADELDVPGHQGASDAHPVHVPLDRQPRRGVVPGQRQPHGAGRDAQLVDGRQFVLDAAQQAASGRRAFAPVFAVYVHLQRPDAGVRSTMPSRPSASSGFLQRVHPHPQPRSSACSPYSTGRYRRRRAGRPRRARRRRPRAGRGRRRRRRHRCAAASGTARRPRSAAASGFPHRHEADRVARAQLARFHSSPLRRRGADEAAEARPVGTEHDRGVAGEVERADRIGRVVDVGRVQPGLAAVLARPRAGADQPDTGARGVVVHRVGTGVSCRCRHG